MYVSKDRREKMEQRAQNFANKLESYIGIEKPSIVKLCALSYFFYMLIPVLYVGPLCIPIFIATLFETKSELILAIFTLPVVFMSISFTWGALKAINGIFMQASEKSVEIAASFAVLAIITWVYIIAKIQP